MYKSGQIKCHFNMSCHDLGHKARAGLSFLRAIQFYNCKHFTMIISLKQRRLAILLYVKCTKALLKHET